jgi:subtilisin family serine protease
VSEFTINIKFFIIINLKKTLTIYLFVSKDLWLKINSIKFMFLDKIGKKVITLIGCTSLIATLGIALAGSFTLQGKAQTAPLVDKYEQYKNLSLSLEKNRSVNVLVNLSVDTKYNKNKLEEYAKQNYEYFPEFAGKRTDGSEKEKLQPVFATELKNFTEELRQVGVEEFKTSKFSPIVSVKIDSQDKLKRLFETKSSQYLQENQLNVTTLDSSNPVINSRGTWNSGLAGAGKNKIIAILDTGVQNNHPFLSGKVKIEACFSTDNAIANSNCPTGVETKYGVGSAAPCNYSSSCSHGTHVAGIAAGKGSDLSNNFHGVAREASIMAVQVFSRFNNQGDCGSATAPCTKSYAQDQIDGLNYVTLGIFLQTIFNSTEKIASANMSLGGGAPTTSYCDTDSRKSSIDGLLSFKVATVIAAGNDGSYGLSTPGCISSAITVGSTTNTDAISGFSNYHQKMDLFAPGSEIKSSVPVSNYGVKSGTSMAAPMVAGAFAILSARFPTHTVATNLKVLQDTGVKISFVNGMNLYTEKRLKFCRSYYFELGFWRCKSIFTINPILPIKL